MLSFLIPPSEKQGSEKEMNEMAFRSAVMGRVWLDKYSPLQAPATPHRAELVPSLRAGAKVALLSPLFAAPCHTVTFPRSGQQHPAKPAWELLQTVQCYIRG